MTKQDLTLKVINAQAKVEKKEAIVQKHRNLLSKMIASGADEYDICSKREEIDDAERKLKEAKRALSGWQAELDEKVGEDDLLEANAPEIIKTFLDGWKSRSISYYTEKFDRYCELREYLRERELDARREALRTLPELEEARKIYDGREPNEYDLHNLSPREAVEAFLCFKGLGYNQIQERLRYNADSIVTRMLDIRDPKARLAWLEKEMEQEKREKLLDLVQRMMKVVGRITDAGHLSIGPKGDINGYIQGTEGKASVETIGAGGYNVQCYHFRTLIHEI